MSLSRLVGCVLVVSAAGLLATGEAAAGPVAFWSFDNDVTANNGGSTFDGTAYSGAAVGATQSKWGGASLSLARANSQYVQTASPFCRGSYTYSVWYYLDVDNIGTSSTDRYSVLEAGEGNFYPASLGMRDVSNDSYGDVVQAYVNTNNNTASGKFVQSEQTTHKSWRNAIVTASLDTSTGSTTLSAYIDGVSQGSTLANGTVSTSSVLNLGTYRAMDGRFWNGYIDDVAVWNRVLSADEITALQSSSAGSIAETVTWTGAGGNSNWWSTSADVGNWGGSAPQNGDALVFSGESQASCTNNTTANNAYSMAFASSAGEFTIGGNAIDLAGSLVNNSPHLQTINTDLRLTGDRMIDAASGDVTIGGAISEDIAGRTLTKAGDCQLTLTGINSYSGDTSIDAGTLVLAEGSSMLIDINTQGDSTMFLGTGTLTIDGTFAFDISGITAPGTWNVVASGLNETYGSHFGVTLTTNSDTVAVSETAVGSGVWRYSDGSGTVTFNEATGGLTYAAVPEPSVLTLLASGLAGLIAYAWRRRR